MHADEYAFRHRREKKREFRTLWISRISAAVKPFGLNYSKFMHALSVGNVKLNRKVLSEMAIHHKKNFESVVTQAKQFLTKST
jgi:large subunit ribosomal protein L20